MGPDGAERRNSARLLYPPADSLIYRCDLPRRLVSIMHDNNLIDTGPLISRRQVLGYVSVVKIPRLGQVIEAQIDMTTLAITTKPKPRTEIGDHSAFDKVSQWRA